MRFIARILNFHFVSNRYKSTLFNETEPMKKLHLVFHTNSMSNDCLFSVIFGVNRAKFSFFVAVSHLFM